MSFSLSGEDYDRLNSYVNRLYQLGQQQDDDESIIIDDLSEPQRPPDASAFHRFRSAIRQNQRLLIVLFCLISTICVYATLCVVVRRNVKNVFMLMLLYFYVTYLMGVLLAAVALWLRERWEKEDSIIMWSRFVTD